MGNTFASSPPSKEVKFYSMLPVATVPEIVLIRRERLCRVSSLLIFVLLRYDNVCQRDRKSVV